MKVAVVGAGSIGQGYAAFLATRGHEPMIFSPRDSRFAEAGPTVRIETFGMVETAQEVALAQSAADIARADAVVFCILGNGHRRVMEMIAPHIRQDQAVIISSHCSLGALYLSKLLADRGVSPLICCWATTVTGGPIVGDKVSVRLLRKEVDVATLPAERVTEGLAISSELFGDRFKTSENLLAISLSNLNPPIHLANTLLNFTRVENAETWQNYGGITEAVGRIVEALDDERLAIAAAFDLTVRTVREHYVKSFPALSMDMNVHQLAQTVEAQRKGSSPGPTSVKTRFITEDVPFGIYLVSELGKVCGISTPVHDAGITLINTIYGRDLRLDNDILGQLELDQGKSVLVNRATYGWAA